MEYVWSFIAFIAVVALILFVERQRYVTEGKKHLQLLRDPGKWAREPVRSHSPSFALSMLGSNLNQGKNYVSHAATYANAKLVGSTPSELWQIHRAVHRWEVEQYLDTMRQGHHIIQRFGELFDVALRESGYTLEELGSSEEKYAELQKATLLSIVRETLVAFKETGDDIVFLGLRNEFERADVCRVGLAEIDEIAESIGAEKHAVYQIPLNTGPFR